MQLANGMSRGIRQVVMSSRCLFDGLRNFTNQRSAWHQQVSMCIPGVLCMAESWMKISVAENIQRQRPLEGT